MPKFLDPATARIAPLKALPENLGCYVEEISQGLLKLYGPAAAADYRLRARRSFASSLAHPAVEAYAATLGKETAGIIMGFRRGPVGEVSLLHVLERFTGQGIEQRLVKALVSSFRDSPLETILFECLSLCKLDIAQTFQELGFERIARELMLASLRSPKLQCTGARISTPCTPEYWELLAACIVDAYTEHPEQRLHHEVNSLSGALDFISRVSVGNYGPIHSDMMRMIHEDTGVRGGILGCPIAPETGFVLQVVVRRDAQRGGLGRRLLQELAEVFREAGLTSIALGVTSSSPARRLYQSAGFRTLLPVDAYVWWNDTSRRRW